MKNKKGAPTKGDLLEDIFSNDEQEKQFLRDLRRAKEEAWLSSTMQWNTIHGIPWKRGDELGHGSYGSVHLGMRQDQKLFAVKSTQIEYPTTSHIEKRIQCQMMEIKMIRLMRCKYSVTCLGCGRSNGVNLMDGKETLDVFLEYVVRGSLKDVAKARQQPFEETPYVRQYTYDILKALQYMKTNRIVHGDIKMRNLLLSDDCVKLADWGGAKQLTKLNLKTFLIGTVGFYGPEVEDKLQQSYPSDIYSLGCTVIEMITGKTPKRVEEWVKMTQGPLRSIKVKVSVPEIPQNASPECKDFLEQCLRYGNRARWTAAELLHHPFITNRDPTSTLPYDMPVPTSIGASLLRPPRQIPPELLDEPMTKRVYKHLNKVPTSWIPRLMLCAPPDSQPQPPLPPPRWTAPESPPTDSDGMDTVNHLFHEIQKDHLTPGPAPTPLPKLRATTFDELMDELAKHAAPPPRKREPRVARNNSTYRAQFNPVVAVKELKESLVKSTSLMERVNNEIYVEATLAAPQPLPGDAAAADDDDPAQGLFPNDPNVARSPDRLSGRQAKRPGTFGMGCAGDDAVDVLTPMRSAAVKVKGEVN